MLREESMRGPFSIAHREQMCDGNGGRLSCTKQSWLRPGVVKNNRSVALLRTAEPIPYRSQLSANFQIRRRSIRWPRLPRIRALLRAQPPLSSCSITQFTALVLHPLHGHAGTLGHPFLRCLRTRPRRLRPLLIRIHPRATITPSAFVTVPAPPIVTNHPTERHLPVDSELRLQKAAALILNFGHSPTQLRVAHA